MDLRFLIIFIPLILGFLSSISMIKNDWKPWYNKLNKPSWNPPSWLFAPVWSVLYLLMGVSSYLILISNKKQEKILALLLFYIQLFLNIIWSPIFFGLKQPKQAFIVIVILWFLILLTIVLFMRISVIAGLLLVPYLLWVSYATTLNGYIMNKNK
jgi:tryptophan-rich sensory protein